MDWKCRTCGVRNAHRTPLPLHGPDFFCFECLCELHEWRLGSKAYDVEVTWARARLQEAGDEWVANNARVEALRGVLPRPALEIVARELGVKYWELNNE